VSADEIFEAFGEPPGPFRLGGLGSGRRKDRGRKTVESYWTLDFNRLSEMVPTLQASDPPTIYAMRRTLLLRCEL
jgi:hypothetical protein